MAYECPKCHRYGMAWDGRAKVLMCHYNTCSHVIRLSVHKQIPTPQEITAAIKRDTSGSNAPIRDGFVPA